MKNTWKNTVFSRLFITFMLIMTPIYIIGINIYNWGVNAIRNEIYNSMISQVNFYLNSLETEIQRIKILQFDCISDDNLNSLTYAMQSMNEFEKGQAMLSLQQRLYSLKNSSHYIENVSAGIANLDVTISANGGVIKGLDNKIPEAMEYPYISSFSQLIYNDGSFYSNVTNLSTNAIKKKFSYMITIKLSERSFKSDLAQFDTYNDSMTMMTCLSQDIVLTGGDYANQLDGMRELLSQQMERLKTGTYFQEINNKRYLVIYSTSDYLGLSLVRYIHENEVFSSVENYKKWLWIFLFVSLIIILLFSLSVYNYIHKPLSNLVRAFRKVEIGDFNINITHNHNDEFRYLYVSFNAMITKLGTLIDQVYKQKILMQNAQLKQLQAQINPHFLYNTFFILYSMVSVEDNESALLFLKQLGSYFKYITRSAEDEVPLAREVEHAHTYASIQEMRFSKRMKVEFEELPEKFKNFIVPRLIIQPIIENAFKYGLEDKECNGLLSVKFQESGNSLYIIVEDNGNGMDNLEIEKLKYALTDKQCSSESTGIINIHRRLQLKYGENSGLSISGNEMCGLKVVIILDLGGNDNV